MGHAFTVCIRTENQDQASFCPFALCEVSVLTEPTLGHLRYYFTDVPPQSNSQPDSVSRMNCFNQSQNLSQKLGSALSTSLDE